jgi:hypothetical protein
LNLTGTGSTTLYLQSTTGTTVNANICVGLYVVPGGVLTGTLTPIGTTFTLTASASGVPTPITLDFNAGIGPGAYAVTGIAGTEVELVVSVAATNGSVEIVNDPPAFTSQANLDENPPS